MTIAFSKYQGTGNDFIVVDNRYLHFAPDTQMIQTLCDRRFGIGADGLILVDEHEEYDFRMTYYNSDGTQSLCGNGSRCAMHFARELNLCDDETTFITTDGIHKGHFSDNIIHFQLKDISGIKTIEDDFWLHNGSPHYVKFVTDVDKIDVVKEGRTIRNLQEYAPDGTNVNFIQLFDNQIVVRTYERGVEDETLSCGTGVTAAAVCAGLKGLESPINIETRGGNLYVSFTQKGKDQFTNIYLSGPAIQVFKGNIEID